MSEEKKKIIYLSWVAVNNDPYNWFWEDEAAERLDENNKPRWRKPKGELKPGPTLSFFTEAPENLRNNVERIHFFYDDKDKTGKSQQSANFLMKELKEPFVDQYNKTPNRMISKEGFEKSFSAIDHQFLIENLRNRISTITDKYTPEEYDGFYINLSPGTPAMHSVWIVLANEGHFDSYPDGVDLFQMIRPQDRDESGEVLKTVDKRWMKNTLFSTIIDTKKSIEHSEEIIPLEKFKSSAIKKIRENLLQTKYLDIPTLLLGETGTGKTFLAKHLHDLYYGSEQKLTAKNNPPFERVMCSQFLSQEDTMRSEVLGYWKGAFTGADKDTEGALHRANNGTLFLDEIWDIPMDLQEILLQAMEKGEFSRKGNPPENDEKGKTEKSNFKLIMATWHDEIKNSGENINDENSIQTGRKGTIRPDFWYRIRGNIIEIPPLRKRPEDIEPLWKHIYKETKKKLLHPFEIKMEEQVHQHMIEKLKNLELRGNIRDVQAIALQLLRGSIPTNKKPPNILIDRKKVDMTIEYFKNELAG